MKAPAVSALRGRHRRLCRACLKSPLERLTAINQEQNPMYSKQFDEPDFELTLSAATMGTERLPRLPAYHVRVRKTFGYVNHAVKQHVVLIRRIFVDGHGGRGIRHVVALELA